MSRLKNAEPWIEWGGDGPTLHFAHANGFPPRCYAPLLDPLTTDFAVFSWEARPLWSGSRPESIQSWENLATDMVNAMWSRGLRKVLGVGHSLGGVLSLMAAAQEPDLFSALVLVDPVVFSGLRSRMWQLMKTTGQSKHLPLLHGALRRVDWWPDRDAAKRAWSGKPVFAEWTASAFEAYLEHGLVDASSGGVRLRYPKAWEARVFELIPHDVWPEIRRIKIPILGLRGEKSDTFLRGAAGRLARVAVKGRSETIAGRGHFLPMEDPDEVGRRIRLFAAEAGVKTLSP